MNAESLLGKRLNGKVYWGRQQTFKDRFRAYQDIPPKRTYTRQFGPWVQDLIFSAKMRYYLQHRNKGRQRPTVPFWFLNEVIKRFRNRNFMGIFEHKHPYATAQATVFSKKMARLLREVRDTPAVFRYSVHHEPSCFRRLLVFADRGVHLQPFGEEFSEEVRKASVEKWHGTAESYGRNYWTADTWPAEGFGGRGFGAANYARDAPSIFSKEGYFGRRTTLWKNIHLSNNEIAASIAGMV